MRAFENLRKDLDEWVEESRKRGQLVDTLPVIMDRIKEVEGKLDKIIQHLKLDDTYYILED